MCTKLGTNRRPVLAGFCITLLALTGVACKGKHNLANVQNEEPDQGPRLVSNLRMNDAPATAQLLNGFYPIENGAWRWTAGKFSVLLRTPPGAAQGGATLNFSFNLPDVVLDKLKSVKLTASVNGMALKSDEYKTAGTQIFTADVPAAMLAADSVKFDFALDKSLPPGADKRELGIIATSVALAPR